MELVHTNEQITMYNKFTANEKIIEFCRFPIPRTAVELVKFLKNEVENFYPKSRPDLVINFLRRNHFEELVAKNILIEYSKNDPEWENIRAVMKYFLKSHGTAPPRKIFHLYQINFLYLQHTPHIYKLPVLKDINFDLITLFYPLIKDKKVDNFFWTILNFLYSCELERDKLKIELYRLNFSEKERDLLEKFMNYSAEFKTFFQSLQFKPDADKAVEFLRVL